MKDQECSAKELPEIRRAESENPSGVEKDEVLMSFAPLFTITKLGRNQICKIRYSLDTFWFIHKAEYHRPIKNLTKLYSLT